MSLINEALKKAQKQRTGEAPPLAAMPPIGGESATRIARRAKPAGINTLLVRLGIGVTGLAIVVVGGVMLLRNKPAAPETKPATAQSTAVVAAATPAVETPVAAPTSSPPAFVVPNTPPPVTALVAPTHEPVAVTRHAAEAEVIQVEQPKPAPVVPTTAAATPAPTPTPAKPADPPEKTPPARLEPNAIAFIDSIRVAGIRASSTDSKVLMNDRVYRIGDLVEHQLGIRLVDITSGSLTFEDSHGARYTRIF